MTVPAPTPGERALELLALHEKAAEMAAGLDPGGYMPPFDVPRWVPLHVTAYLPSLAATQEPPPAELAKGLDDHSYLPPYDVLKVGAQPVAHDRVRSPASEPPSDHPALNELREWAIEQRDDPEMANAALAAYTCLLDKLDEIERRP